eukprot:gene14064-15530_t
MSSLHVLQNGDSGNARSLTPVQARMVLKAAKHWRTRHEKKINNKLSSLRDAKRSRNVEVEKELDQIVARQVPFDILTNDWFKDKNISRSQRVYLLEKLIPTLVLGVEKLVTVAAKKNLIGSESTSKDFNPINYLAQFLMRNNPRYSNFAEAVPYTRSINKLLDELKTEAYNQEENRLAKMKTSAKRRKEERSKTEKYNFLTDTGRSEMLQELCLHWTEEVNNVILLHLIQNALKSFQDYAQGLPEDQKTQMDIKSIRDVGDIDAEENVINFSEFQKIISDYSRDFTDDLFAEFVKYMNNLASEYRTSAQMETIRMILANLFLACDHGETGLLDRRRVLKLLESFYDNIKEASVKQWLLNPRKWPVVDIDEQDESPPRVDAFNEKTEQGDNYNDAGKGDAIGPPAVNPNGKSSNEENGQIENHVGSEGQSSPGQQQSEVNGKIGSAQTDIESKNSPESDGNNDHSKFAHIDMSVEMAQEIKEIIDRGSTAMESKAESPVKTSRGQSVATGSIFDPTTLNQVQFMAMLEKFLGEDPSRQAVEALVAYIRAGYIETEEERKIRLENARLKARSAKHRLMIDQLFDLWDVDGSGYLEMNEVEMVLTKWRDDGMTRFKQASEIFGGHHNNISRKQFKIYIDQIVKSIPGEDCFDSLTAFLFASVERSFEERKRGEFRKKCLFAIEKSGQTSGSILEPVFKTTFQSLSKDAEVNGRNKKVSAYIAILEANDQSKSNHKGETRLRYVSCTPEDVPYVYNKLLYRDMKNISFNVIDSGKPIHVPRIIHNGGVYLWNSIRKDEENEGSLVMLPLKDYERRVIGILGIDTLPDPREKAVFVTHEISFYQGVAKALSSAIQFIDSRRKTIKIAESAVSWILRRSQNVQEVTIYLVEPGLKPSDGLVLRKMIILRQNKEDIVFNEPPRLERKDNLFRDYLFKCIDTSETLTADAYGERHTAFPLRDAVGMAVAIVDISIGIQRQLPQHENKEIHRMLKLLAAAHKEISREIAGEEKNIVLEVEKEHQEKRIDVLFDRIMLQDLRANVGRLDARAFAEIKSYKEPPKIIHDIVKAVLEIHFGGKEDDEFKEKLEEWITCKQLVNAELVNWISTFDPTASTNLAVNGEKLAKSLSNVPPGAVAKHGSLPAQYLFNWAFVCLSLIEHTSKMRETRPGKELSLNASDNGNGNHDGASSIDVIPVASVAESNE